MKPKSVLLCLTLQTNHSRDEKIYKNSKSIKAYQSWSPQLQQRIANLKKSSLVQKQLSSRFESPQTLHQIFSPMKVSALSQLARCQNLLAKSVCPARFSSTFAKTKKHRSSLCAFFSVHIRQIRRLILRYKEIPNSPKRVLAELNFSFALESISWLNFKRILDSEYLHKFKLSLDLPY